MKLSVRYDGATVRKDRYSCLIFSEMRIPICKLQFALEDDCNEWYNHWVNADGTLKKEFANENGTEPTTSEHQSTKPEREVS